MDDENGFENGHGRGNIKRENKAKLNEKMQAAYNNIGGTEVKLEMEDHGKATGVIPRNTVQSTVPVVGPLVTCQARFSPMLFKAMVLFILINSISARPIVTPNKTQEFFIQKSLPEVLDKLDANLDSMNQKFDAKLDSMNQKLDAKLDSNNQKLDAKLDSINQKLDSMNQKLDAKLDSMNQKLDAKLDAKLDSLKTELRDLINITKSEVLWIIGCLAGVFCAFFAVFFAGNTVFDCGCCKSRERKESVRQTNQDRIQETTTTQPFQMPSFFTILYPTPQQFYNQQPNQQQEEATNGGKLGEQRVTNGGKFGKQRATNREKPGGSSPKNEGTSKTPEQFGMAEKETNLG